jgi:hypothetical protein
MKKLSALIALSLFAAAPMAFAQNGGTSCAGAVTIATGQYDADTTAAPNWMGSFGPLVSPSNDVVYTFVAPADPSVVSFAATASSYQFALYLIPSCASGAEPTPIGATATLNAPINSSNISPPLVAGNTYFLAVTGTAAGGAGANGTTTINATTPVSLQSFEID